jgi:hypothetical protein
MNLTLRRKWLSAASTVGELFIDGVFECFVLEDRYRPSPEAKVKGATCIPLGRYEVVITESPKFKRELPLLLKVPGFSGVRIHPGNSAKDTEGCLLPGRVRHGEAVLESRAAFDALFEKLKRPGPHFINVELAVHDAICLP